MTGDIRPLPQFTTAAETISIPIVFEPLQSFFIVFKKSAKTQKSTESNFAKLSGVTTLDGPWEVAFDPKWGGPAMLVFESLTDWVDRPEMRIKYYSGTATYRRLFDAPHQSAGEEFFLELGEVKNLARVKSNGKDLGTLWCAPWRVSLKGKLRKTGNKLEIAVANLWPNRLIGDAALPEKDRFTWTTWQPFDKKARLLKSGLLGPVTIQSGERNNQQ